MHFLNATSRIIWLQTAILSFLLLSASSCTDSEQSSSQDADSVRNSFTKSEHQIPMRDGAKLFTAVYMPKSGTQNSPILLVRTPYSVRPYGEDEYPSGLRPGSLMEEGYIFVYQDVRGKYMSEGEFEAVRPHIPNKEAGEFDESTDTYDTVEWLLENLEGHNGRVAPQQRVRQVAVKLLGQVSQDACGRRRLAGLVAKASIYRDFSC